MKRILAGGVSVALGLSSVPSQADEVYWRPAAAQSTPPQPVALLAKPAAAPARPAVTPTVYRFQSGPNKGNGPAQSVAPDGWTRIMPASAISIQTGGPSEVAMPSPLVKAPVLELSPIMPMATDSVIEPKADVPPTSEAAPMPTSTALPVGPPAAAVASVAPGTEICCSIVPSRAPK
jgi:hypothetical protein